MDLDELVKEMIPLYRQVGAAVLVISGDRSTAEDCAQEALLRYWQALDSGTQILHPKAWMLRCALNWSHTQHRRSAAEGRALRRVGPSPEALAPPDFSGEVHAAIRQLPRRQREVVVLHYLFDMTIASIAESTGLTDGAVKNALFNGRRSLRAALDGTETRTGKVGDRRG